MAVSAIQKALPLLILPLLTNILGPEKYGEVAVLISCFTLVSMTFGLGLETIAYRYGKIADADAQSYVVATALLQRVAPILIGLTLGSAIYLMNVSVGGATPIYVALAVMAASIYCSAWQFPTSMARVRGRLRSYFLYALTYSFLLAVFKLLFVLGLNMGVLGWVIADITASLSLFLLTFRDFLPFFRGIWSNRRMLRFRPSLRLGGPLVVSSVSQWITGSMDRILVAALLGTAAAGHYALAAQVATIGGVVITELTKYIQPHLAPESERDANRVLARVAPRQILLVSVACVLTSALGAFIAPIVFGPAFGNLGFLSSLMALPLVFTGLSFLGIEYLSITRGKTRSVAVISILTAGLSIILNFVFLPRIGVPGAVGTVAITSVITFSAVWFPIMRSELGIKRSIQFFWPAAVGLACILAIAWMVAK
ncbi:oligosaccharide flippase family protein [Pseudarthrobacter sp. MDT1-22]